MLNELSALYDLAHDIERTGLSRIADPAISVAESLADVDYPALTDDELSVLLEDARATDDANLRRLIKHHVALRETADRLLDRLKETAGPRDDLVRVAEHFIHADWKRTPSG